jgi:hypothetical protein
VPSRSIPPFTEIKEPLNLLIHAADRLDLSVLVEGAGDGDLLFDRQS